MAHPLESPRASLADAAWAGPLKQGPPIPDSLHEALPALALQGRWREIASRCRAAAASATASADAALSVAAYHLLSLLKLNMLEEASTELAKLSRLGCWDEPQRPGSSSGSGSLAAGGDGACGAAAPLPFALRRIRAELPWWLGRKQEAVDRLYQLLVWCAAQEEAAAAAGAAAGAMQGLAAGADSDGGAPAPAPAAAAQQRLWRRRHRDVLLTLVNKHCRGGQYGAALCLLDALLAKDDADVAAWQEVGLVQALLGDAAAAAATLQRVEALLLQQRMDGGGGALLQQQQQQQQRRRQQAVHCNRGLLCFLQHDYRGAAREYQSALSLDPCNATAANNHALALMYSNHLSEGTAALEAAFRRAPAAMLQEPIVTNLASLLELGASPTSLAAKQRMAEWVATAAPDDFDLSATRTVGA